MFWCQLVILRPKLAPPKKRSGSLRTARRFSKPSPVAKDLLRVGMFFCFFWDGMEAIEITHQQFCLMSSETWICEIDKYTIQIQLEFLKHDLQDESYLGIVGLKGIFACDLKGYSNRIVIRKTDPSEYLGQHVAVQCFTADRRLKKYLKMNQWKVSGSRKWMDMGEHETCF